MTSNQPLHDWFGLTYSSYLVLPRLALQEQPIEWQKRFLALLDEMEASGLQTPEYHVLRDDPEYTRVELADPEDHTSRPHTFIAMRTDPWANYRRGTVAKAAAA